MGGNKEIYSTIILISQTIYTLSVDSLPSVEMKLFRMSSSSQSSLKSLNEATEILPIRINLFTACFSDIVRLGRSLRRSIPIGCFS